MEKSGNASGTDVCKWKLLQAASQVLISFTAAASQVCDLCNYHRNCVENDSHSALCRS